MRLDTCAYADQTLVHGTVAPLLVDTEPTAIDPTLAVIAAVSVHVTKVWPPAGTVLVAFRAPDTELPPLLMAHDCATALEVPVLVKVSTQSLPATLQVWVAALIFAELVNDPKRPNTNPAMAMAAMRVMAMRMTVASTGEMAFLFFL